MQDIPRKLRIIISFLMIAQLIMPSSMILAQTATIPGLYTGTSAPDATALPVVQNYNSEEVSLSQSGNKLTVHQNDSKAVIDWESFNIGADAWTHFDQQGNTDWTALNRIYDSNPSLIFGQLTADGKIYLINQNGILFGPNSKVDVYGLAASSLDIAEAELEKNLEDLVEDDIDLDNPSFSGDDDRGAVSNHGVITVGRIEDDDGNIDYSGGHIYLVAPEVENGGSLDAATGQVVMAAGTDAEITILDNDDRVFPYVYVNETGEKGTADNLEDGSITTDSGVAGMYGRVVNQDGYIRAITTVINKGRIELHASEKVATGANSVTETPITDSDETVHASFSLTGGEIDVAGLSYKQEQANGDYANVTSSAGTIVHSGEMTATSGTIIMNAVDRIYLDEGSSLDVSGEWVTETAEDNTIEATLNSVELKNDYAQKDGELQGETIEVLPQEGSGIGDLSDYFDSDYLTAKEMATAGGDIELTVEDGDIILREGATIDFSGGGVTVEEGYYNTTKLVSGGSIFDISDASNTLEYDGLANYNKTVYSKYGLSETYEGLYYGGANSILEYTAGYIEGDDAGSLALLAAGIVLDGTLDGSVTAGIYQTLTTEPEEEYGEYTVQTQSGMTMPRGGTLYIGDDTILDDGYECVTEEVMITDAAPVLPDDFDADTDLQSVTVDGEIVYASEFTDSDGESLYLSIISDDMLNEAGLSSIYIRSNAKVTVEEDVEIELYSGGLQINESEEYSTGEALDYVYGSPSALSIYSRAIEYSGVIIANGGEVAFNLIETTYSSDELSARIYISGGSVIDVSGDTVDNSMTDYTGVEYQTIVDGGQISFTDNSRYGGEIILVEGSQLDVSGGYVIDTDGALTSGSAGSIELTGTAMVLDGDLCGYSLVGESGGSITIQTKQISVQEEGTDLSDDFEAGDNLSEELAAILTLADDEFADSGFSSITLKSFEDLEVGNGVYLSPSLLKLAIAGDVSDFDGLFNGSVMNYQNTYATTEGVMTDSDQFIMVSLETLDTSSITLMAGEGIGPYDETDYDTYAVVMSADSSIEVSPGGDITLFGDELDIAGDLTAPAGTISLSATGKTSSAAIAIQDGSLISAAGTNQLVEDSAIPGIGAAYEALDGGSVILSAGDGSIIVASGASIDVSGSTPIESIIYNADDINNTDPAIKTVTTISNAGGIYFDYYTNFILDGELIGDSHDDSAYGGTLSIAYSDENYGLTIDADDIEAYLDDGFDALAFSSLVGIAFTGDDISAELGLSLELDAPEISGSGQTVYFSAPAITLANTDAKYPGTNAANSYDALGDTPAAGDTGSSITLASENIEVNGSIAISGFETTTLSATGDIQLTDEAYYDDQSNLMWQGLLRTSGDLNLQAFAIYPTTASTFTMASDEGRITILPSDESSNTDPVIASVGGNLILAAREVDHQGYLAAPMGSIAIAGSLLDDDDAAETVFISDGSVITVAGDSDSSVLYGELEDEYWTLEEKPTELTSVSEVQSNEIEELPEKTVEIEADTVVMQAGAEIDVSGGGTAYASEFVAGTEGYENPFDAEGTYVIVAGIHEGGDAVYLEESSGLPAGTYTLLSEDYAHIDGAYVIQHLGDVDYTSGIPTLTSEGYEVVVGFDTVSGTEYRSSKASLYSIRTAEEVMALVDFDTESLVAGDAGSVNIQAATTVLEGDITSDYLEDYTSGQLFVSGTMSATVSAMSSLGTNYAFDDLEDVVEAYLGTALILDSAISDSSIETLNFGSLALTESVVIDEGASLVVPVVVLSADNSIILASGSSIVADEVVFNTPDGVLSVDSDATVEVTDRVDIVAQTAEIDGLISSEAGTLGIESDTIVVVPDEYTGDTGTALYLTESLQGFSGFDNLELTAEESLLFMGETELTVGDTLVVDAGLVRGSEWDGEMSAALSAQAVYLINTGEAAADSDLSGVLGGSLAIKATDTMTIGNGDIVLDGFDNNTLAATGDILFSGEGSLMTAGDLTFQSARITTTYYEDDDTEYESADFSVIAGNETDGYRDITIMSSDGAAGDTDTPGGLLEMTGDTILLSDGRIDITGGWVTLTATGTFDSGEGIILSGQSGIDVTGNDYASGGRITIAADSGSILLGESSSFNVSAGSQGDDAGRLSLTASQGAVTLDGTILGNANGGDGGSFSLDASEIDDFNALAGILGTGGFDEAIELRARSGNLALSEGETLTAHEVVMTADDGDVLIAGVIDASGEDGGDVAVNAGSNLTVEGTIDASASDLSGEAGSVYLNAAQGVLTLASGSEINVTIQGGDGGTVHLRAQQTDTDSDGVNDDVLMDLEGTIYGASDVIVEGVAIYEDANGSITSGDITGYYGDVDAFLNYGTDILDDFDLTLLNGSAIAAQVVAGIEVVYDGDLSLDTEWDLTDDGRSDQAGYITLRASGDLTIDDLLVDHPTTRTSLNADTELVDSWGFNLTAGADLNSADIMAVNDGVGDLVIADGQMVYTENNTIRFASGQDTLIYGAPTAGDSDTSFMVNTAMVYNIATFAGDIEGDVARDLILMDDAVIQSATGDIEIAVGRDLYLELTNSSGSAIRTTGTASTASFGSNWAYGYTSGGGDIVLDIGGSLLMGSVDLSEILLGEAQESRIVFDTGDDTIHLKYWDNVTYTATLGYVDYLPFPITIEEMIWGADYGSGSNSSPTAGLATMGEGSITVVAGNDVAGQIGTFKDGDLSVTAHGDISGYYQVADGEGVITAMGSIISPDTDDDSSIYAYTSSLAIFDAQVEVTALGNIDFGTIFNPMFTTAYAEYSVNYWEKYLDYSETALVSLTAIDGNLSLSGAFWNGGNSTENAFRVLPSTVSLTAGGDISFGSEQGAAFVLAPSATGNLSIDAGESVLGLTENSSGTLVRASLRLSDLDPDVVYAYEDEDGELVVPDYDDVLEDLFGNETNETTHAGTTPLHSGDDTAVTIVAAGDIEELMVITPKETTISAGGDITGLYFFGQNLDSENVTVIQAGGGIDLKSATDPELDDTGFIISGPGLFLVQAVGSIDLGVSQGIQSVGDAYYTALSEDDSALWVIAGLYQESVSDLDLDAFFESVREYGTEYSALVSEGDDEEAAELLAYIEDELIDPLYADSTTGDGDSDINMTNASIQTSAEGADIFILADGDLNVGETQIPDPDDTEENDTGIFTTSGGAVNIFAKGDVNVNESRVMTFRGGDITIWSEEGDINAGYGSTTAINTGSPTTVTVYAEDDDGNLYVVSKSIVWEAPSVGSGIRTLTYDPDGFQGPEEAPDAGDAYIFAPGGVVDAGEAGISAGNVVIAATEVLNAQNIEVGGTSVGVPTANTGPSVSALAGAGTVSEAAKSMDEAGVAQSAEERFANAVAEISDNLVPKWLAVEVIGFVEDNEDDAEEEGNG